MKPTNRLVVVIVLISFMMAMAVAGTAIGLNWMQLMKKENDALRGDLQLVMRAMEEFGFRQIRENSLRSASDTAYMLKTVIQNIGYNLNLQTANSSQLNGARVSALMVDQLLDTATKRWVMISALNMARSMDEMCSMDPTFNGIAFVNNMNKKRLRDAHEAMLVKNGTDGRLSIMTDLRYPSQCPNAGCNMTQMKPAMEISMGSAFGCFVGDDYTNNLMYIGYHNIPCMNMGLVYKVSYAKLQEAYVNDSVAAINKLNFEYSGSTEIMIQLPSKPGYPLTKLKLADSSCVNCTNFDSSGYHAIIQAEAGGDPTAINIDYRQTVPVLATAAKLTFLNAYLLFEIDVPEVAGYVYLPISQASREINPSLNGSQELIFGKLITNSKGNPDYALLSDYKFGSQCPNHTCGSDVGLYEAVVKCENDVDIFKDYRGRSVVSAQMCIPELNLGAVFKFDESDIFDSTLQHTVDYTNAQNRNENSTMELMIGMQTADVYGGAQATLLSDFKYSSACSAGSCAKQMKTFAPMLEALKGKEGDMATTDYRGKKVMSFYSSSNSIGLVFKVDSDEVEKPLVINLLIVLFTALGIVLLGDLILGIAAHSMLASIQSTWDKSRQAVQEQKENFEQLLSALYPKFVKDRLVDGDVQIFLELPEATVFFSDICNFTMLSNQLNAQELLAWIGYTFGVMDHAASYYAIYKIKTIGDAYLAVAGLPNLVPDGEPDHHSLRMLQFASTCIQIFSGRYTHPDAGACLELIASRSAVLRKEQKPSGGKRNSQASSAIMSVYSAGPNNGSSSPRSKKSQCAMRYGVAAGPLTAGVLQGKCPVFDVWGKTVNLACRMESTGRPNCIHVSETVYLAVAKNKASPFTFDKPHGTFAKGFGNVPAYFVKNTSENPPKVLLTELSLEPHLGDFGFDIGGGGLGAAGGKSGGVPNGGQAQPGIAVTPSMTESEMAVIHDLENPNGGVRPNNRGGGGGSQMPRSARSVGSGSNNVYSARSSNNQLGS